MTSAPDDPRSQSTRAAIIDAFNALVLERGIDAVRVRHITDDAGVGRSTFYEHYRGVTDVYRDAATDRFATLADAATPLADHAALTHLLEHIREFRGAVSSMLEGRHADESVSRLAELLVDRLPPARSPDMPLRLIAELIAGSQFTVIRTWLRGVDPCPAATLAESIISGSQAIAASLTAATPPPLDPAARTLGP